MRKTFVIILCSVPCLPALSQRMSSSPPCQTVAAVHRMTVACRAFHGAHKMYPPEETWLDELLGTSNAVVNTRRRVFVRLATKTDAFGNPIVYRSPGKHNPESYDLYSKGANGKSRTGGNDRDDISSWHSSKRLEKHCRPPSYTHLSLPIAGGVIAICLIITYVRMQRKPPSSTPDVSA